MRISDWSSDVCSSDLAGSGRQHRDILATVVPDQLGHRLVEIARLIGMPRQFGEDALRLAECVTEQHRCKAFRTILRPPLEDLGTRGAVRRPYILRRTEGRFGDEHKNGRESCRERVCQYV